MTTTPQANRVPPTWFTRFWAIVRYEMIWNIRKKKFIGVIIIAFLVATLGLLIPVISSNSTGVPIIANPNYALTFGGSSFVFFLFAIGTAMNSISSEFESGTIVPLVTKPVSRTMIFLGKLFGSFIIILVSYIILYVYSTAGAALVYGPQNNLQYMPIILVGSIISTFIWVSLLFAVGSLTKNTIITILVAFGLFLALFIAIPIVSLYSGPSQTLDYFPGSGASGTILIGTNSTSIGAGTDNVGVNLVNYALYPSANITFYKIDISAITAGETTLPTNGILYTESTSIVALRSTSVALAYIVVFLFIAWFALKRSQILE
jgi:ABC-type transport system involved in multi-copper enzyme maturation permease subunit